MRRLLSLAVLLALAPAAAAQSALWADVSDAAVRPAPGTRVITPSAYRLVRLDAPAMRARLAAAPKTRDGLAGAAALQLPLPDGTMARVRVAEAPILAPELQARYPEIRTYLADGDGAVRGRLSVTPEGFRGLLFTPAGTVYIDPYARGDAEHYQVYYSRDAEMDPSLTFFGDAAFEGEDLHGEERHEGHPAHDPTAKRAHGETLRTYRLAVAATGQYTQFHGGTVAGALAAITTTVNRVAGLYETETAISFQIVANNNLVIYTDGATDPYSNPAGEGGSPVTMLGENQANLDAVIGSANYDLGHVFGTIGGGYSGIASIGVSCSGSSKGRGVSTSASPTGDVFDVDLVTHEIGHQLGSPHSFNGDSGNCATQWTSYSAYEPGSGSTIMGYAGICRDDNLQSSNDDYFHSISLDLITERAATGGGSSCGTATATNNAIPTVTAPAAYTLPTNTPFVLSGSATDDTPGSLTYIWEEFDLGPQADVNAGTAPLFRSFIPSADRNTRYFPQLDRLVAGLPPVIGETLPPAAQTLTFRLTARDNQAGGGAINEARTEIDFVDTGATFAVTFASTPGQSFGGTATVTWDVAGTDANGIDAQTVDILYSTDGGATFPTVLASLTANDGSETVYFPATTSQGRIMVRGAPNPFFNVNPEPFAVTATATPPTAATAMVSPGSLSFSLASGASGSQTISLMHTGAAGATDLGYTAVVENVTFLRPGGPVLSESVAGVPSPRDATRVRGDQPQAGGLLAARPRTTLDTAALSTAPGADASKAMMVCAPGQTFSQSTLSFLNATASGVNEYGQSFTAPCTGTLSSITPSLYSDGSASTGAGTTWNATLRLYEGAGTTGTELAAQAFSRTAPSGVSIYGATVRFAAPAQVVAGQTYTWFLDMTGGTSAVIRGGGDPLPGDLIYRTTSNGDPTTATARPSGEGDLAFSASFGEPDAWLTVTPSSGTVAPGATTALTVAADAAGRSAGTYTADLVLMTNAAGTESLVVPVTLVVDSATETQQITGGTGWRLLAPAAPGITVDDLAAINLVSGIPGYYPDNGGSNIFTGWDGASGYTAPSDGSDVLGTGSGFWWYLYDLNVDAGGASDSYKLPTTLVTPNAPTTADTPVALSNAGAWNMVGNPFGQSLDLSGVTGWGGAAAAGVTGVAIYAGSPVNDFDVYPPGTPPVVAPWQGFYVYSTGTGTLTIPESARTTGGTLVKADERVRLAFELTEDTPDGVAALADYGTAIAFDEAASQGEDPFDLPELPSADDRFVQIAFGGDPDRPLLAYDVRPLGEPVEVPMHVEAVGSSSVLTLAWPTVATLPDSWQVSLVDLVAEQTIDLRAEDAYTFEVEPAAWRGTPADVRLGPSAPPASGAVTATEQARFVLRVGERAVAGEGDAAPELSLAAPVPNPARGTATLRYSLPADGPVVLEVFDSLGRRVAALVDAEQGAGPHAARLDTDALATGVYAVRLSFGDAVQTTRLTVVR